MERMVLILWLVTMSICILKVNLNTYHELAKDFRFYEDPGDEFKFPGTFVTLRSKTPITGWSILNIEKIQIWNMGAPSTSLNVQILALTAYFFLFFLFRANYFYNFLFFLF